MKEEKWYDHPGDVFAVIVGSILVCAVVIWAFNRWEQERQIEQATEILRESMRQVNASLTPLTTQPERAIQQTHVPTSHQVYVPGNSAEECSKLTGNVINESWRKCRSGGTVTITQ